MSRMAVILALSGCLLVTSPYATGRCLSDLHTTNQQQKSLDLSGCYLTDQDMPAVHDYLVSHPTITKLNLDSNTVSDRGVSVALANISLRHLSLASTSITNEVAASIAQVKGLSDLDLSMNMALDDGITSRLALIPTLNVLNLSSTGISDAGAVSLSKSTSLRVLDLGYDDISLIGAAALAKSPTLTKLYIYEAKLDDEAAEHLAKSKLRSLIIWGNDITDRGAIALAHNNTLTILDVGRGVGNAGASALAKNTTLKYLAIGGLVGDDGVAALSANTTLTHLDLSFNNVTDTGAIAISKMTQLKKLSLWSNDIGDAGAVAIATMSLSQLDLSSNKISDVGAFALAKSQTLNTLFICYNQLTHAGIAALKGNTHIKDLHACDYDAKGIQKNNVA